LIKPDERLKRSKRGIKEEYGKEHTLENDLHETDCLSHYKELLGRIGSGTVITGSERNAMPYARI